MAALSVISAGQAFGELALMDPAARRQATVVGARAGADIGAQLIQLEQLGPAHADVDRLVTEALVGCIRLLSGLLLEAL